MKEFERFSGDKKIVMNLLEIEEIENLNKILPVTQVSGLCFTKEGKLLIISSKPGKWGIPGGKLEKGENFEETFKREVKEEACVKIKKIMPLAFIRVHFQDNPNKEEGDIFYQGRYLAIIDSINPIKEDPATGIKFKRKFISLHEFTDYVNWPDAHELISLALKKLKKTK